MAAPSSCSACNARLTPESAPGGLCLACLLATALEPDDNEQELESSAEAHTGRLAPGTVLGRFRIGRLLGKGGMAAVYEAREAPPLERTVALKVLPPEFLHEEAFAARFVQEARVVAGLEHANIVPIYASGIDEGLPWMSMRLLGTGNLSTALLDGRLPVDRTRRILRDVAEALDYAHAAGVIHRDIKPSNILLDQTGRAWVSDFGLARLVEGPAAFTAAGIVAGTPHYMAPEQALGAHVDHACDIYSLGVVAYEMLTGSTPFPGHSPIGILMRHVNDPIPPPPRDVVPDAAFAVLRRALAKNPADRWRSAAAFVTALEATLQCSPAPAWAAVRRPAATAAGGMLTVIAVLFFWAQGSAPREAALVSEPVREPLVEPQVAESSRDEMTSEPARVSQPIAPAVPSGRPPQVTRPPTPAPSEPALGERPPDVPVAEEDQVRREHTDDEVTTEAGAAAVPQVLRSVPAAARLPLEAPSDVVTHPVLIRSVEPRYPDIAKRLDVQGDVVLRVLVGRDGTVTSMAILESPHVSLSDAAKRAVQQYRYEPARRNGVPIQSDVEITVSFRLR